MSTEHHSIGKTIGSIAAAVITVIAVSCTIAVGAAVDAGGLQLTISARAVLNWRCSTSRATRL